MPDAWRPRAVPTLGGLALAWAAAGAAGESEPRFGVTDVMDAMVVPASDALFGVGRAEPESESAWTALLHQAVVLGEAGQALTVPGRSRGADWDAWSRAMTEAAEAAADAIDARDLDGVLFAGGDIIESCTGCHRAYLPLEE